MKKTNNKGFSLVELIVVIAIMAVLIGVLAPQFLKYVERSRKSVDIQNVAAIVTACDVYAADPAEDGLTNDDSITLKQGTVLTVNASTNSIHKALSEAGIKTVELKSKEWAADADAGLTFTVTVANGVPSYTVTGQKTGLDILTGDTE